ncbi:hypothetical protein CW354_06435 [Marinicaulis flavus]|uniref:Uncharacterized protein n=1 Tax=Hyphococcus luteus TaxID=2058213 RepID=A0A2S7K632_9PROT|nr:hypothetical protein CW354_06435 [Marinicaulis flavus]
MAMRGQVTRASSIAGWPILRILDFVMEGCMIHIVRRLPPPARKALFAVSVLGLAAGVLLLLR